MTESHVSPHFDYCDLIYAVVPLTTPLSSQRCLDMPRYIDMSNHCIDTSRHCIEDTSGHVCMHNNIIHI